jgi:methylglutaconyl-CoA hydratase
VAYRYLSTARDGGIEYVTLNRPDVRNAFNEELIAELTDWGVNLSRDAARNDVRVAVLSGAGKVFCAGADVRWMAKTVAYTEEENLRDATRVSHLFAVLDSLPVPLIGRIHGAAIGGGAGLAAVCDVAVSEDQAVFGFTEVKIGIVPAVISPFVLAKIGRSAARELFLTGARFSAVRAREIGLVHAVVPAGALDAEVSRYADEVLASAPEAFGAAKALVAEVWQRPLNEAMAITARAIATRRVSAEGQEGLRAFLDKRTAAWSRARSVKDTKDPGGR